MSVSLGGLASGLDTNTLISQLMQLEAKPRARVVLQQRQIETRQTALRDIQSKLRSLRDAAADLRLPATWAPAQTLTAAPPDALGARLTGGAGSGDYRVSALQLARSEQRSYDVTAGPPSALTVTLQGGDTYTAARADGATAADLARQINEDAGAPVSAVIVKPGDGTERLVLTSRSSGAASGFSADLAEVPGTARAGQDARVTVDGDATVYTSPTNVVAGAIPGVELTLRTAGDANVTIGAPRPDAEAIVGRVRTFVDRYNAALDALRARVTESRPAQPASDADRLRGTLRADAGLTAAMTTLRTAMADAFGGRPEAMDELAEIGVGTGAAAGAGGFSRDAVNGRLNLDEGRLRAMLDQDFSGVRSLLAGGAGGEGISQRLAARLEPLLAGGSGFDARLSSGDRELVRARERLGEIDARLGRSEARWRKQFSSLESALQASQSRGQWLSGQLAALNARSAQG